MKAEISDYENW